MNSEESPKRPEDFSRRSSDETLAISCIYRIKDELIRYYLINNEYCNFPKAAAICCLDIDPDDASILLDNLLLFFKSPFCGPHNSLSPHADWADLWDILGNPVDEDTLADSLHSASAWIAYAWELHRRRTELEQQIESTSYIDDPLECPGEFRGTEIEEAISYWNAFGPKAVSVADSKNSIQTKLDQLANIEQELAEGPSGFFKHRIRWIEWA